MYSKFEIRGSNSGLPVIPVVILLPFWEGSTLIRKVMWVNRRENVNNLQMVFVNFTLFSESVVFIGIRVGDVSVNWQNYLNQNLTICFFLFPPLLLCAIVYLTFVGGKCSI